MSLKGIQDSQHTPTAALQTSGFPDPQLIHNFPLNPEISLGDNQQYPVTAMMEPRPPTTYHQVFSEDHMCIDCLKYVRGELIHVFQRHDLKCHQTFLILPEKRKKYN